MKTELHIQDMAFVGIGGSLCTWVGETITCVVVGLSRDEINFNRNDNKNQTKPHEIHIFSKNEKYDTIRQFADETNGVICISFITPKVKAIL